MKQEFLRRYTAKAFSYETYKNTITDLLAKGLVTGTDQSASLVEYTRVNLARMNRIEKTFSPLPELQHLIEHLTDRQLWLVITEGWCGDAAQSTPVFNALAELSDKIELGFVLRDEHPALMDMYLTGKSRSIPKLVILCADTFEELGVWGPRPHASQLLLNRLRNENLPFEEMIEELYRWYAQDKTLSTQEELLQMLENISVSKMSA